MASREQRRRSFWCALRTNQRSPPIGRKKTVKCPDQFPKSSRSVSTAYGSAAPTSSSHERHKNFQIILVGIVKTPGLTTSNPITNSDPQIFHASSNVVIGTGRETRSSVASNFAETMVRPATNRCPYRLFCPVLRLQIIL